MTTRRPLRALSGPVIALLPGLTLATALTIFILVPIIAVFLWAFAEVWRYPSLIPTQWGLRYWQLMLARQDVWVGLRTSIALSLIVTALSAVVCLPAAYAFARMEFPGKSALLLSFLATQAFPKFGLYIAIATIFFSLGLVGTFAGVVLIQLVNTLLLMVWIPVGAFQNIDRRLEEAARDVGASPMRTFFAITLPQAGPAIAAALLLTFVGTFYETEGAFLIGAPHVRTMPVLMISLINNQLVVQYGAVLSVMLWVPSFLAMLFARRILSAETIAGGLGG